MHKVIVNSCMTVFVAFTLSACASIAVDPATGEKIRTADIPEKRFLAEASSSNKDGSDKEIKPVDSLTDKQFAEILGELPKTICDDDNNSDLCLRKSGDNDIASNFGSLSGITTQTFIRVARSHGNFFGHKRVDVRGKILQNCLHDRSLSGYHYNKEKDTLRLCVLMATRIAGPADGVNVRFQYFHVEADNVGVDTKRTADGGPYAPPFDPDNVFYEASQKTGFPVSAATAADFMYKLYAYGKNVRVERYWEANIKSISGSATFAKYKAGDVISNPRIALYFTPSDLACVDMLFPDAPQPELPTDAIAGVHYCLGRCENPPIVNTK